MFIESANVNAAHSHKNTPTSIVMSAINKPTLAGGITVAQVVHDNTSALTNSPKNCRSNALSIPKNWEFPTVASRFIRKICEAPCLASAAAHSGGPSGPELGKAGSTQMVLKVIVTWPLDSDDARAYHTASLGGPRKRRASFILLIVSHTFFNDGHGRGPCHAPRGTVGGASASGGSASGSAGGGTLLLGSGGIFLAEQAVVASIGTSSILAGGSLGGSMGGVSGSLGGGATPGGLAGSVGGSIGGSLGGSVRWQRWRKSCRWRWRQHNRWECWW
jgi:hypothetical protein